jgi:hypothetical protein
VVLSVASRNGIDFESEIEVADVRAPISHREQGLGWRMCLMAIAFCVEMGAN